MTSGFRIGVDRSRPLHLAQGNLQSASSHSHIVSDYISREVQNHRLRMVPLSQAPLVRCNPIGLIPKQNQPGKFRLIVNLSAPIGFSVNDAIDPDFCTLRYTTVHEAAKLVARSGPGAQLAKLDLQSAYRQVPVHPADQPLLGVQWQGATFVDQALPFGLRSAPIIFTAVADSLAWAMKCEGITNVIHYLDDFLFWSDRESPDLVSTLTSAVSLCSRLGLPAAPSKVEGPSTVLTFLGIEVDTDQQELRLPQPKLCRLRERINWFRDRRNATKHQIQSLVGLLGHAASVIPPGKLFMRNLIDVMKCRPRPSQRVRLTAKCKADIAWWALLAPEWNGISYLPGTCRSGPIITSDASGSWGCGAFSNDTLKWFQLKWPHQWSTVNIAVKELVPVVASAAIWGKDWSRSTVLFRSDNMAVVQVLNAGTARDQTMSHLLRCLFFFQAYFKFDYKACHISGKDNEAADALSRNRLNVFLTIYPQAQGSPTQLPPQLGELLTDTSLTWTSPHWETLFASILQEVQRNEH